MEIDAYADVREARDKLIVYREQALLYASKVLPNQQEMLNSTEQLYNTMTADIYELLDAKKNQMTAYLHYQTALKEYWMAKIDLNSAIGGVIKEEEP